MVIDKQKLKKIILEEIEKVLEVGGSGKSTPMPVQQSDIKYGERQQKEKEYNKFQKELANEYDKRYGEDWSAEIQKNFNEKVGAKAIELGLRRTSHPASR